MKSHAREAAIRIALCAVLAMPHALLLRAGDNATAQRERMVSDQIEARGIRNPELVRAMRITPRHLFVPANLRAMAYQDHPLPIGYGATISQPYVVALMTQLLAPAKKHRVLEIGTGSGYQAAILAQLTAEVYTIELIPELARASAKTLAGLGYTNVTVRQGDGYKGWPEQAPFDRIIVTAAPPKLPQALIDQLAKGGRLVAPIGQPGVQELMVINKKTDGTVTYSQAGPVSFVPMKPAGK